MILVLNVLVFSSYFGRGDYAGCWISWAVVPSALPDLIYFDKVVLAAAEPSGYCGFCSPSGYGRGTSGCFNLSLF